MYVKVPSAVQRMVDGGRTMYGVMADSTGHEMVERGWTNGFSLTRKAADLLFRLGEGAEGISRMFLMLMAEHPDTFVAKKFDEETALRVMERAREVLSGRVSLSVFDGECLMKGINPGSLADIGIAGIFTALMAGWKWDC